MKTYKTENNNKEIKIEVLTIDEAKKKGRLTKDEAYGYHVWHKDKSYPVDNKHIVYGFNVLPNHPSSQWVVVKWFDQEPTKEEAVNCVVYFDNN